MKKNNFKILAGITTYNPNIELLTNTIKSIIRQVDKTIIVDNGSNNISEIRKKIPDDVYLIENNKNYGIAYSLNRILDYCIKNNYTWFITLDQDSICDENIIKNYIKYIDDGIGQLTCIIQDCKFGVKFGKQKNLDREYEDVMDCITSGSLNNTNAIQKIQGYNESLFIDGVDFDISLRLINNGFIIRKINRIYLLHNEGNGKNIEVFGKSLKLANHEPWRNYYARRNMIYISRKQLNGLEKFKQILKQILYAIGTIVLEDRKIDRIKYNIKGIIDGFRKEF